MHDQNENDLNEITEQINMFYDTSDHKKQVIIEHLDTSLSEKNACDSQYLDQSFDLADNNNHSIKHIYDFSAITERQVYPKENLTERSSLSVQSVNIPENKIVSNFIMNMSMLAENQANQSNSIHIEQQINKLQMNLLKNNKKDKHRPLKKKILFLRSKNNPTNKMPKKLIVRKKEQKQKQQEQKQKYKQLTVKQLSQIYKINQKLYNAYIVVHRLTKKQQIHSKQINKNLKQLKIKQNNIRIQKQQQKQLIKKIKIQQIQYQQKLLKIENQIIKKQKQIFIQNYCN